MFGEAFGAARLAGFGPAQFDRPAHRRLALEIVIEGNGPEHFRARNIQGFGDQGDGAGVDIAELFLQRVKDRQHRAFQPGAFLDQFAGEILVPGDVSGHANPPTLAHICADNL